VSAKWNDLDYYQHSVMFHYFCFSDELDKIVLCTLHEVILEDQAMKKQYHCSNKKQLGCLDTVCQYVECSATCSRDYLDSSMLQK